MRHIKERKTHRELLDGALSCLYILLVGCSFSPQQADELTPTWDSLNAQGMAAFRQQRYAQAKAHFFQALESIPSQPAADPRRATTLNNLGATYKALGEYEEAKLYYQRSLAIIETIQGPTHPDVAIALNNLAGLHYEHEIHERAELLWQRGLKIYEKHFGRNNPHLIPSLQALALVTKRQQKYEDSERYYKRVIEILEQSFGQTHGRLIPVLEQYAHLLEITGRNTEAETIKERIESIRSVLSHPTP